MRGLGPLSPAEPAGSPPPYPTLAQTARVWGRVALMSFGGPAGQIAVMHRIVVDERRWIGGERFLHALNFCMLLPGPEAMQLAAYLGWLMHGVRGALLAGGLFVLPGAMAMLILSAVYAVWGGVGLMAGLFFGLKAAVLAIVVQAVLRIGGRALGSPARLIVAAAAFVAIFAFGVPFPAIVAAAALIGWVGYRARWPGVSASASAAGQGSGGRAPSAPAAHAGPGAATAGRREPATVLGDAPPPFAAGARRAGLIALVLWLVPVAVISATAPGSVWEGLAHVFSRLAVVTFGGAYAGLAYIAQTAVEGYGWLRPGQMLDGLGLAETTPGPLVLVFEFVGFLAGFGAVPDAETCGGGAGLVARLGAGAAGAALVLWVTFVPCFAWIFLGAPAIEGLRGNPSLAAALAMVTAAVVGVIVNLAVWFGWHFIVPGAGRAEGMASADPAALALSVLALVLIFATRIGAAGVLGICGVLGVVLHLAGLA